MLLKMLISPSNGPNQQIKPHPTRWHYPLITYLWKIKCFQCGSNFSSWGKPNFNHSNSKSSKDMESSNMYSEKAKTVWKNLQPFSKNISNWCRTWDLSIFVAFSEYLNFIHICKTCDISDLCHWTSLLRHSNGQYRCQIFYKIS